MKKKITTLLFLFFITSTYADFSVNSFRKMDSNFKEHPSDSIKDKDGNLCALIKLHTSITGFEKIDCDQSTSLKTVQKEGELWVYMPTNAKKMSIYHPEFGVLRDFYFPEELHISSIYELVFAGHKQKLNENKGQNLQWLLIKPTPATANVFIDNILVKTGEYNGKYKPGAYTYSIEAPLFHTSTGKVIITDNNVQLDVILESASGYIYVSCLPEEGAKVLIDGKMLNAITPCKSLPLSSGEHIVQVFKEFHQQAIQQVSVEDEKTTNVIFALQPNFGTVSIKSISNSTILVNGQPKGSGSWSGPLNAGMYTIEAHLNNYRNVKEEIEVEKGETKMFDLKLVPITSSLAVNSTPSGANILIEGKNYGVTPKTIDNLLIGDYYVQLVKEGYVTTSNKISIQEGNNSAVNSILSIGRKVKISTNPTNCNLMIDGVDVGPSPYSGTLSFGSHTLHASQNNQKAERIINVLSEDGVGTFELSLSPAPKLAATSRTNIKVDMIFVKGGTFKMGNNAESQLSEYPIHDVTVSDFYMQTTEMTQFLWKIVMGSNPSKFKGDDLPVESVSWNVVQEFILKLNSLSGNKYRLPTEAEWEYAAGGGQYIGTNFSGTNINAEVGDFAWTLENSNEKSHPVGLKKPNKLGLYDMTGNVWEWCSDWLGIYSSGPQTNPTGSSTGTRRSNRGGSWRFNISESTLHVRGGYDPGSFNNRIGFRLVMSANK
jgi:formylglycine-generating enzyme required for sulfatase activity